MSERRDHPIADEDNPEWTRDDFARAKSGPDMPEWVFETFPSTHRRDTRLGRAPPRLKRQITLRLDPDVIERFKAGGPGWQTRINEALRKAIA